jgi:hypothetical protein
MTKSTLRRRPVIGVELSECTILGSVRNRRYFAIHQGVDEGRVANSLQTCIIVAFTTYPPGKSPEGKRFEARITKVARGWPSGPNRSPDSGRVYRSVHAFSQSRTLREG